MRTSSFVAGINTTITREYYYRINVTYNDAHQFYKTRIIENIYVLENFLNLFILKY